MICKKLNDKKNDKIFLAGHNGLVGSAILRKLKEKNLKISLQYQDQNSI